MRKFLIGLSALFLSVGAHAQTVKNVYMIDANGNAIILTPPTLAPGTGITTFTFPSTGGTVLTSAPSGGSSVTNFGGASSQGAFNLYDANGNSLTFKTIANLGTASSNLIWPANAAGVLTNDGSGNLTWGTSGSTFGSGITVGTASTTNGTIAFKNAGGTQTQTISASNPATTATFTLPNIGASGYFAMRDAQAVTAGDLLVGSSNNLYTTLAKGANGKVLGITGGSLTWVDPSGTSTPSYDNVTLGNNGGTPIQGYLDLYDGTTGVGGNKIRVQAVSTLGGDYTYTLPDVGANANFVMTEGNQTLNGTKTFGGTVNMSALTASLPLKLDGSKNIISQAIDLNSSEVTNTLQVGKGGTGATTFTSKGILYGNTTSAIQATGSAANAVLVTDGSSNPSLSTTLPTGLTINDATIGGTTSISTSGAISTSSASGITASAGPLTSGDATHAGSLVLMNGSGATTTINPGSSNSTITFPTGTGTLAMVSGTPTPAVGDLLYWDNTNSIWKRLPIGSASNGDVLSISNAGAGTYAWTTPASTSSFVTTNTTQTISGAKTFSTAPIFSAAPNFTAASNQLSIQASGSGNKYTITAGNPATTDRVLTIPDPGANASFVMTEGAQTINGTKTFGNTALKVGNATFDATNVSTSQTYTFPSTGGTLVTSGASGATSTLADLTLTGTATTGGLTLDVTGAEAFRATSLTISSTTVDNLDIDKGGFIRLTGTPGGKFTLKGIMRGTNGRRLRIYNATGQDMVLNNNGSGTASQSILTMAGGDITLSGTDGAACELIYDGTLGKWVLQSSLTTRTTGVIAPGTAYNILTNQNSTTTDPTTAMSFDVVAGGTYEIRGTLQLSVGNTSSNSFFLGLNPSAGTLSNVALSQVAFTPVSGNTAIQGIAFVTAGGTGGEQSFNSIPKNTSVDILVNGIFTASASGQVNVIYHWSTNNGSTDLLKANSYLSCTRVN